jgi:predicted ester cyclase
MARPLGERRASDCVPIGTDRGKRVVRLYYQAVLAGRRLDVLDDLLAPGFVGHDPAGAMIDRSDYIDAVRMLHAGFSRLIVKVDDQLADKDRVTTRWTATGMHTGAFAGIPPTGREVMLSGIDIHRLRGDRLVELWEQLDLASLVAQLI